jgi:hypothetical protein
VRKRHILRKKMFIAIQSTQFWNKHTMRLHVLYVSAYYDIIMYIEQLQTPFLLPALPPYTAQSALYRHVVYVMPLYYKMC